VHTVRTLGNCNVNTLCLCNLFWRRGITNGIMTVSNFCPLIFLLKNHIFSSIFVNCKATAKLLFKITKFYMKIKLDSNSIYIRMLLTERRSFQNNDKSSSHSNHPSRVSALLHKQQIF